MKTTIFFFSGTGNSLKIAKDLSKERKDWFYFSITLLRPTENSI